MVLKVLVSILCMIQVESRVFSPNLLIRGGCQEEEGPVSVLVSTSFGSQFLDKKKRLQLSRNSTIEELKQLIEQKFPANPPVQLQRLFAGIRYLSDDDRLGNVSTGSSAMILLDMPSGTSIYNKTLTIYQALEAYAALTVQQTFIGDKIKALYSPNSAPLNISDITPESAIYRDIFLSVNTSLYKTYAADILQALEDEKEPEVVSGDTAAWRTADTPQHSPLVAAFAKEFDINLRSFKNFMYFSFLFAFFSYFGTNSEFSSQLLLALVPIMWVSKLRQLRLLTKLTSYVILPLIPRFGFLMPLLPAPQQVIALETAKLLSSGVGEAAEETSPLVKALTSGFSFIKRLFSSTSSSGKAGIRVARKPSRVVQRKEAVDDEDDESEGAEEVDADEDSAEEEDEDEEDAAEEDDEEEEDAEVDEEDEEEDA